MTATVMNTGAPTYILTNDIITTCDQSMHVITIIQQIYIILVQKTDTVSPILRV